MHISTIIFKKLFLLFLLVNFSCRGYGIRIEFVTPDDTRQKTEPVEKKAETENREKATTDNSQENRTDSVSESRGKAYHAENSNSDFTSVFQDWSSASNWLIRTLKGGTSSPGLIKPEIDYVRRQLLSWTPFFKGDIEKQNKLTLFATEYQKLSNLYTRRRRSSTAALLKILEKKIIRIATARIKNPES